MPIDIKRYSYTQPFQYSGLDLLTADIAAYVTQRIRSVAEFITASEIYQQFLYEYAGDAYRRKLFAPINGIRSWMFKSFPEMPIGGFGVIDAFDNPTRAYYAQRKTFAPVAMSFAIREPLASWPASSEIQVPVRISNASSESLSDVVLEFSLYDLHGQTLKTSTVHSIIQPNHAEAVSTAVWQLPPEPGIYVLQGRVLRGEQELASTSPYLKVVPTPVRGQCRVLILGSPAWTQPIAAYLANLGARVTTVLAENTVIRPTTISSSERLRQDYDVIWLAGCDNYWREAPPEITRSIMGAVYSGCAFVHTGSPASFHGGGEKTAALDLTPLSELIPVTIEHENDISLKSSYQVGSMKDEFAAKAEHHLTSTAQAASWIQRTQFADLTPESFHILRVKQGSKVLIEMERELPVLVSGQYGRGKTFAYMGFSPEESTNNASKPFSVDRAIRASPQGHLFAIVSSILLALASPEPMDPELENLMESRTKPLFESLLDMLSGSAPKISAQWTRVSPGEISGHIGVVNGDHFTFGVRLRLDGDDQKNCRSLALWSNQYFDLLPNEAVECLVSLLTPDSRRLKPFSIVVESHSGTILGRVPGPIEAKAQ